MGFSSHLDKNGKAPGLFGVMSPSRIPNSEDDKFDEYGVSEVKELWKEWSEDVKGSGQVHPAILNNDLVWVLYCLKGKCTKDLSGRSSGVVGPKRMKRCTPSC